MPEDYLLYVGRIDAIKLNNIVDYFLGYKKKYIASRLKLVLVGGIFGKTVEHPDIIYTGFVGDAEKVAIQLNAKVIVNPSKYESLSLILLETMSEGKAMLVNGQCNVLKEHCVKSDYAALYYMNRRDLCESYDVWRSLKYCVNRWERKGVVMFRKIMIGR